MSSCIKRVLVLILSILFFSGIACLADTIHLKSGKIIEGEIVKETAQSVKIRRMDMGFYTTYKKKFIKKIEKQGEIEEFEEEVAKEEHPIKKGPETNVLNKLSNIARRPQFLEKRGYILYFPSGIDKNKEYPLVIIFHPAGKAAEMIEFWKPIAEENQFILYASKKFRNNVKDWLIQEDRMIRKVCLKYSIDDSRVITTGFSGGGMGAHMYSVFRDDLVNAVITNSGRIHPGFKKRESTHPKKKIAVFLASAGDSNYRQMLEDRQFLKDCLWMTRWLTFDGGHVMAPIEIYKRAVEEIRALWE